VQLGLTLILQSSVPVMSGNSRVGVFTPHRGNSSGADRPSACGN